MPRKPVQLTREEIVSILYSKQQEHPELSDEKLVEIKTALEKLRKIVPKYYVSPFLTMDADGIEYFDSVYNQAVDSVEAHIKYGDPIQQSGRKAPLPKSGTVTKKAKGHRARKGGKSQRKKKSGKKKGRH